MTELLLQRHVILEIGVPGQQGRSWGVAGLSDPLANELRISFKVDRKTTKTKNEAEIQIYNPNPDAVALAQAAKVIYRLHAGYHFPKLIFQGSPIKHGVNLERTGPDRILKLQAQDGGRQLANSHLNVSYETTTRLSEVVQRVAKDTGLSIGEVPGLEDDVEFPNGITLNGTPEDIMDRMAEISGADWSVQNGSIQVIKTDGTSTQPAVLFSAKNGNLLKVNRKEKGKIEMHGLLEGSIMPGRRFVVESEDINGIFKAQDVTFEGDSGYEDTYVVKALGRPSP